jgi:lantibiotic transport system permease protein
MTSTPRLSVVLAVEAFKLRRSLALLLAVTSPALIALFIFFNQLRFDKATSWVMALQSSAGVWAFFMLPMSVTALTVLIAQTEHGPRTWDHLRSLPLPRWHLYAAKLACVLGVLAAMTLLLAMLTPLAIQCAGWLNPEVAANGELDFGAFLQLLGRIYLSAWLLVGVQLWIALRYASFVPALVAGIGGTFFAVVATSAKVGIALPWQIPVNQLAADPGHAQIALVIGCAGGCVVFLAMLWSLSRREVIS